MAKEENREKQCRACLDFFDISLEQCPHCNYISAGVNMDETVRINNFKKGRKLCDRCDGTGNQLYFMYQKCRKCNGNGYI